MKVKVEISQTAAAGLRQAIERAAAATVEELYSEVVSAQVMPFDTGDMQNNRTTTSLSSTEGGATACLMTDSPQARRLYYHPEYNFQTVNNPNARGRWLEPWISGDKKGFLPDTFCDQLRKELMR